MVEKAKYLAFEQNGQEYNLYDLPDGFVFEDDLDLSSKKLYDCRNVG